MNVRSLKTLLLVLLVLVQPLSFLTYSTTFSPDDEPHQKAQTNLRKNFLNKEMVGKLDHSLLVIYVYYHPYGKR